MVPGSLDSECDRYGGVSGAGGVRGAVPLDAGGGTIHDGSSPRIRYLPAGMSRTVEQGAVRADLLGRHDFCALGGVPVRPRCGF